MSFDWIRQQFASLGREETARESANHHANHAEPMLSLQHTDGRPVGPDTMRIRLRDLADRAAWAAERRAEAAERARQEAERRRYRVAELNEAQVRQEFERLCQQLPRTRAAG